MSASGRYYFQMLTRGASGFLVLVISLAPAGCSDDPKNTTTPSCDDLQREADTCKTSEASKAGFATFGATCESQTRFTEACRQCLSGKICSIDGTIEQCDPLCGK